MAALSLPETPSAPWEHADGCVVTFAGAESRTRTASDTSSVYDGDTAWVHNGRTTGEDTRDISTDILECRGRGLVIGWAEFLDTTPLIRTIV
jgi:hypothetical protein